MQKRKIERRMKNLRKKMEKEVEKENYLAKIQAAQLSLEMLKEEGKAILISRNY